MKLNTIFFAVMASFALAGPLAVPDDVPALISEPKPADVPGNTESTGGESINAAPARDCRQCDDFYRKCMGSTWCWYDPMACSKTCNLDTCRKFNKACTSCGYTDKC
ncbi:hypothetical protein COCC4DRAFT_27639 [Bipolaris maydis ATCC 48331]|uniref:ShKT domain-containing protein n=2 Tax=Cochliobolus heterostrophus TaxID=5016 RepID=M2UGT0_COCH5|nr:uncharacterized protein COCC4DRAFT_27639 [Bipolaris maydis ATCC 48331]EMD87203.1 hypothetical protein COCHEDRAFT_1033664 [Bipolaris maydis C5]KAH7555132.1 hypothetical protein BM1_07793 [Bipolaris maydis]ENI00402.1 hypothetical protein COCC4DRAFT_27639 [Bipolaris maydis ATCC 48331]KAJ5022963.1 hypothetical protein J3E73DRAFT_373264 [Bipolaris maydis]KAJ6194035.1 hypothetical protein J3E72DRAFT_378704 [Bipolaris maydis]